MKKESKAEGLSNVFNELEKADLTGLELDRQLIELGFNPAALEAKIKDRLSKINAESSVKSLMNETSEEFDPLLLAAYKGGKKGKNLAKKMKKD